MPKRTKAQELQVALPVQTLADKGQKPTPTNRNIPAFLNKLYNMVSDSSTDPFIKWNEDGTSFLVFDQDEFSKQVLPRFFKHNNFTSFIRQLNMYGFHKIPHLEQGTLIAGPDTLEFQNDNFQKDRPDLLAFVVRRKNVTQDELVKDGVVDLNGVINEIAAIKRHQFTISADLQKIQRENQAVWRQSEALHLKYQQQQDTINKILGFLATVFQGGKKKVGHSHKKRRLLLEDASEADDDEKSQSFSPDGSSDIAELIRQQPVATLNEISGDIENLITPAAQIPIPLEDPIVPLQQDLDILDDRLDSLSFLMGLNGNQQQINLSQLGEQDKQTLMGLVSNPTQGEKLQTIENDFLNLSQDDVQDAELDEFFAS